MENPPAKSSLACSSVLGKPSSTKPWFWHGMEWSFSRKKRMIYWSSIRPLFCSLPSLIASIRSASSCAFPSSSSASSASARAALLVYTYTSNKILPHPFTVTETLVRDIGWSELKLYEKQSEKRKASRHNCHIIYQGEFVWFVKMSMIFF